MGNKAPSGCFLPPFQTSSVADQPQGEKPNEYELIQINKRRWCHTNVATWPMQASTDWEIRCRVSDPGGANRTPRDRFGSGAAEYHDPSRVQSTVKHRLGELAWGFAGSSSTKPIESE